MNNITIEDREKERQRRGNEFDVWMDKISIETGQFEDNVYFMRWIGNLKEQFMQIGKLKESIFEHPNVKWFFKPEFQKVKEAFLKCEKKEYKPSVENMGINEGQEPEQETDDS